MVVTVSPVAVRNKLCCIACFQAEFVRTARNNARREVLSFREGHTVFIARYLDATTS